MAKDVVKEDVEMDVEEKIIKDLKARGLDKDECIGTMLFLHKYKAQDYMWKWLCEHKDATNDEIQEELDYIIETFD